ncbi:phasyl DNA replicon protein arp [Salmonella enterica subsp. enterica serovar Mikawasima]|nr:phasyl DNA replicon protein arp [Salmonella enterica subsp. enterica serovar Mikawasima]
MADDSEELLISRNRFGKITSKSLNEIALQGVVSASEKSGDSLPCLYSNNCIRIDENNPVYPPPLLGFELKTQVRKSASCLAWNVEHFCKKFGIENLGFLTLTFRDHVVDIREAQRRFKSLVVNVLKKRYPHYIRVVERQKSGRIHYHLLVVVGEDIRTGFDFRSVENGDYRSANKFLKAEWAFWRKTAPAYRFGRTELLPIKSGAEAIARYVGKYIGKHFSNRLDEDKGARLVDYSRGARVASTRLMFVSDGSAEWRRKVGIFVHYIADSTGCEPSFEGVRRMLGPRWAYHWREFIASLP